MNDRKLIREIYPEPRFFKERIYQRNIGAGNVVKKIFPDAPSEVRSLIAKLAQDVREIHINVRRTESYSDPKLDLYTD